MFKQVDLENVLGDLVRETERQGGGVLITVREGDGSSGSKAGDGDERAVDVSDVNGDSEVHGSGGERWRDRLISLSSVAV